MSINAVTMGHGQFCDDPDLARIFLGAGHKGVDMGPGGEGGFVKGTHASTKGSLFAYVGIYVSGIPDCGGMILHMGKGGVVSSKPRGKPNSRWSARVGSA